jgi:hypothetical protein
MSFRKIEALRDKRAAPPSSFMAGACETDCLFFVEDLRAPLALADALTLGTLSPLGFLFANL